jgi:type VI protein secretion system component VasK
MRPTAEQSRPRRSGWSTIVTVAAAIAACAVCCAGPLLAVLGGLGAAFSVGAVWVPALGLAAAVIFMAALVLWRARRITRRLQAPIPVQLGLPGAPAAVPATAPTASDDAVGTKH